MSHSWAMSILVLMALIVALPNSTAADAPPSAPALTLTPTFIRCDLEPQASKDVDVLVTAAVDAQVRAVETDCRCVHVTTTLPLTVKAGTPAHLTIHVAGAIPGLKNLRLMTSAGAVTLPVEVVSKGLGQGLDQVKSVLADAAHLQAAVWFVVKDLRGEIRNCGCSDGSLGGIDHLAALPKLCSDLAATTTVRFILVGDVEGMRTGVAAALAKSGWETSPADVVISTKPEVDISNEKLVAVLPEVSVAVNNAKLVRIPLDGGVMIAALVVLDHRIREQHLVAIDRSLPSDASVLAGFAGSLSKRLDAVANPSTSCMACHQQAHATWAASAHARAWASLAEPDRVDACASCHSTSTAPQVIAAAVNCQACHLGSDAHVASGGSTHTTGVTDCRSCHDERRHPTFDRDAAWKLIEHGK